MSDHDTVVILPDFVRLDTESLMLHDINLCAAVNLAGILFTLLVLFEAGF